MNQILHARARTLIAKLACLPATPAVNLESAPNDAAVGMTRGGRQPGYIDRAGDREPDWPMKTPDHFARRLERCHTDRALTVLVADLEACLKAWTHTPVDPSRAPMPGDPFFPRWVRDQPGSDKEIARVAGVSRRRISQIRQGYRQEAA